MMSNITRKGNVLWVLFLGIFLSGLTLQSAEQWKPYTAPRVERKHVYEFTQKPTVAYRGNDRYEITFAVKGYCDVTIGLVDRKGKVVRHLASGVLGSNAPDPFAKNSLKQTLIWNGKDDLNVYVKEPTKLRARVMLGLKPEFHKNMGATSMYDIPGRVQGLAADKDGVYLISHAHRSRSVVRKFGHDMKYIASLVPPPANLPESKLQGLGFIEYEPGKKSIQASHPHETMTGNGRWLSGLHGIPFASMPAVVNGRIYYTNGATLVPSYLYYINTDGSADAAGYMERPFLRNGKSTNRKGNAHIAPSLAASPDGKWIYLVDKGSGKHYSHPVVWRCSTDDRKPAKPFIGKLSTPGSTNALLSSPTGIDTDTKGRIYIADSFNMRIQIFSPDGKHLKTHKIKSPKFVWAHKKTGEIYVLHGLKASSKKSKNQSPRSLRLTKLSPYPEMKELLHTDGISCATAALDSWSTPTRVWTGAGLMPGRKGATTNGSLFSVQVWEETNKGFKEVMNFEKEAMKDAGKNYMGRWYGSIKNKVVADPSREEVYLSFWKNSAAFRFDIATGNFKEVVQYYGNYDDTAFDKRGYMHAHFNPSFYQQGVARFDPDQIHSTRKSPAHQKVRTILLKEVPYDYGVVPHKAWHTQAAASMQSIQTELRGVLPVRDQGGSKYFQDGIGVNMRGDIAEECNIYYVPKMDDVARDSFEGAKSNYSSRSRLQGFARPTYAGFLKEIAVLKSKGKQAYFIKRAPGVSVSPATIWTWSNTGELKEECAVIAGNLINGVMIDEDLKLYFTVNRQRLHERKVFLNGRMGVHGGNLAGALGTAGKAKRGSPFTGTYIKSAPRNVRVLIENSASVPVNLAEKPNRPVEVGGYIGKGGKARENCWVQGAEWLYAGASPIVVQQPCSCPTMRCGLDWYKRSYVIEQYRHSFGILDTNGNLITHMGQYGNRDSGDGPKSQIPVGGDNIAVSFSEYVSATDNYVCYDDNGERLAVAKLNYHTEESVDIPDAK